MLCKYCMDKNKLKQWIKTVAEIRDIKPTRTAQHSRLATEIIVEFDEDGEAYEVEQEITENPTLGFELVKIKEKHRLCDLGCGKIVTDQVIEKRLCFSPERHWRTRCATCGNYKHPEDGSLVEGGHKIAAIFYHYFRDKNK